MEIWSNHVSNSGNFVCFKNTKNNNNNNKITHRNTNKKINEAIKIPSLITNYE